MKKLYVIADQSLSKRQQFVQGAHAIAEFVRTNATADEWPNGTLVMLKTKNLQELADKLHGDQIHYSWFNEPYYDGMLTAICALDIGDYVDKLQLI
jgi:hypothetical protein